MVRKRYLIIIFVVTIILWIFYVSPTNSKSPLIVDQEWSGKISSVFREDIFGNIYVSTGGCHELGCSYSNKRLADLPKDTNILGPQLLRIENNVCTKQDNRYLVCQTIDNAITLRSVELPWEENNNYYYYATDDQVYFQQNGDTPLNEVVGATDLENAVRLPLEVEGAACNQISGWWKNDKHVYQSGVMIPDIDPTKFNQANSSNTEGIFKTQLDYKGDIYCYVDHDRLRTFQQDVSVDSEIQLLKI